MAEKCKICLSELAEGVNYCINCGAERGAYEPKTIDELRAYCEARKMPLDKMRFFLGVDYKEPKAFGVYEDVDGSFVVYKNKADGTRAVRYSGPDEAFAVRELFIRMQQEVNNQRQKSARAKSEIRGYVDRSVGAGGGSRKREKQKRRGLPEWAVCLLVMLTITAISVTFWLLIKFREPDSGYYSYRGDYYYNSGGSWYIFDDAEDRWARSDEIEDLSKNFKSYYAGYDYRDDYGIEDFSDSEFYHAPSSYSYDDDYGYDYDYDYDSSDDWSYDDWDSDYTDWDSDW